MMHLVYLSNWDMTYMIHMQHKSKLDQNKVQLKIQIITGSLSGNVNNLKVPTIYIVYTKPTKK